MQGLYCRRFDMNIGDTIIEELLPALEGAIPAVLATASAGGIPNVTYVWQVFYVDERRVALSRQFFNKTETNIRENPYACVLVTSPITHLMYKLHLQFEESQSQGPVFEKMSLQLAVVAGIEQQKESFDLISADIYSIVRVERLDLK